MANSKDFEIPLANGNYNDAKVIHKFGYNPDVETAMEDVIFQGGVYTWLSSALQLEAVSTDADDTVAGAGEQQVTVEGLDDSFDEVSAVIDMNGASASTATTQTFRRIHRAYVSRVGTYMATSLTDCQQGNITIRTKSAGATHIVLGSLTSTRQGQSLVARYTIPRYHKGFLNRVNVITLSTKPVNIYLYQRTNANITAAPGMTCKRLVQCWENVAGEFTWTSEIPIAFDQMTDVWLSCNVPTTTAAVQANYELVQVRETVVNGW